ncbi:MAG: hypothetical protein ABIS38_03565 [Sphingomicrobium sp.]
MSTVRAAGTGAVQRLVILLCAVLLGVQVVRSAAVAGLAEGAPQSAAKLWPGHPAVETQLGMVAIALATGKRLPIPDGVIADVTIAALKAPLAPEPYLVRGVQAQLDGQSALARAAFLAAERRDPRSLPAHYFLAEQDLRNGNVGHGLDEVAALATLAPGGVSQAAPFIATFARDRRNWPAVRALFRRNPQLATSALTAMASNAANADAVVSLSDPAMRGAASLWLPPLLQSLIAAGDYAKARSIWAEVAKVRAAPGDELYDAAFAQPSAPPPFNWALTSSSVGLAERQSNGRLHAIFYGQQNGPLARQLLMLKPGAYRLSQRAAGDPAQLASLMWTLTCVRASDAVARIDVATAARAPWMFVVPASCPAQWLELAGVSSDIVRQSEVTISDLKLTRAGNGS